MSFDQVPAHPHCLGVIVGDIILDPAPVFVALLARLALRVRVEAPGGLAVAQQTRGQGHLDGQPVLALADVQHVAAVRDAGQTLLATRVLEVVLCDAELGAITQMQVHLAADVQDDVGRGREAVHRAALVRGQRVRARKMRQVQVVLDQVVFEQRFRERPARHARGEGVVRVFVPHRRHGRVREEVFDKVALRERQGLHVVEVVDGAGAGAEIRMRGLDAG